MKVKLYRGMEFTDSEYGDLRTTPMISDVSWRVNLYDLFDYVGEKGATSWRSEEPNITSSIQLQPEAGSRPSASSRKANTNQAPAKQSGKGKTAKSSSQTDTDDCGWGAIPALKKLHNIAVLLHTSVLLYQSWVSAIGVALGIDNITRWNSWFNIIDVALQRRSAIVIWLMDNIDKIGDNHLEKDDWDLLQKTHEFLQPFKQGTLLTEKNLSNLSDAVMVLDILLVHCRRFRVRLGACV